MYSIVIRDIANMKNVKTNRDVLLCYDMIEYIHKFYRQIIYI